MKRAYIDNAGGDELSTAESKVESLDCAVSGEKIVCTDVWILGEEVKTAVC
jgi:hypothetical protein